MRSLSTCKYENVFSMPLYWFIVWQSMEFCIQTSLHPQNYGGIAPLSSSTGINDKKLDVSLLLFLAAKSLQSCPTLCDPIDSSPPGSPVPGGLQARTLEWAAISFSNAWKWKVKVKSPSRVWLLVTPWSAAYQAPLSMGFSRQEYWSGVPLPSPIVPWLVTFFLFLSFVVV